MSDATLITKIIGEMRAYAHGLMYNDFKVISDDNLNRILGVMGTAPVYQKMVISQQCKRTMMHCWRS